MSKINDIKSLKRGQRTLTPAQALILEENNVSSNEENKQRRKEEREIVRRRVSFDLRTDLHKELKMQSIVHDRNIYIMIEEALEKYLSEIKNVDSIETDHS